MGRGGDEDLLELEDLGYEFMKKPEKLSPEERFFSMQQEKLSVRIIRDEKSLRAAIKYIESLDPRFIAVDFETSFKGPSMSATQGAIRLIQIGIEDEERGIAPEQFIIDCYDLDPRPLGKLMRNENIEKQIHYMGFEQEWSQIHLGTPIKNVFDTCIAFQTIQGALRKMDEDEAQEILPGWSQHGNGLGELSRLYLGMEMPKDDQSSNWGREDLLSNQMVYAAMDVVVLPYLARRAREISGRIEHNPETISENIDRADKRIKEKVARAKTRNSDDMERISKALRRARDLEEVEVLERSTRQMTVYGENRPEIKRMFRERKKELSLGA